MQSQSSSGNNGISSSSNREAQHLLADCCLPSLTDGTYASVGNPAQQAAEEERLLLEAAIGSFNTAAAAMQSAEQAIADATEQVRAVLSSSVGCCLLSCALIMMPEGRSFYFPLMKMEKEQLRPKAL